MRKGAAGDCGSAPARSLKAGTALFPRRRSGAGPGHLGVWREPVRPTPSRTVVIGRANVGRISKLGQEILTELVLPCGYQLHYIPRSAIADAGPDVSRCRVEISGERVALTQSRTGPAVNTAGDPARARRKLPSCIHNRALPGAASECELRHTFCSPYEQNRLASCGVSLASDPPGIACPPLSLNIVPGFAGSSAPVLS